MSIIKKSLQLLALTVLPCWFVFAATNPIQWMQDQRFPAVVFVPGGTYVASYVFLNQIPFTMVNPLIIEKTSNAPSEFSYNDLCTGKKLAYLEPCTVTIYLNPTTVGLKKVRLTESYGNDRVPLPELTTTASNTSGGTDVTGATTTELLNPLGVNDSAPWAFTFTNNGAADATGINLSVSVTGYKTTCGLTLPGIASAPNNHCMVQGTYTATSTGPFTLSATLSYAQGAPVSLTTSTNGSATNSGLVCSRAVPFAPETLINSTTPITLLCTNKTGNQITITGHTTNYPTGGADGTFTIAPGGDNCTNQILGNGNSCQLKGTYAAPASAVNDITISLLVDYDIGSTTGLTAQTETSTDIVTQIDNIRTIHLVNQCNFPVWWSMVGGAPSNSAACSSDADCNKGSLCNVGAKLCYYNNYGPISGSYELAPNTGVATTQIIQTPASTLSDQILWKGLISASTQCTNGASCLNNDCQSNGGLTSCLPGVGFQQPATEAEFTFKLTGQGNVDSYDISNVNGFSMPISMATNQTASDYQCGTAGNNEASGSLKACSYENITPPTNMYYWVTNTNSSCNSQNTCGSNTNQLCGLAFDPNTNGFVKNCGDFLGYWAANQICQTSPGFISPFGDNFACNQVLSNPFPNNTYTLTQLLKCSPPLSTAPLFNSCYLSYTEYSSEERTQCCGCTDWVGIANPSASCPVGQTDPQWTKYVYDLIKWMKQACPTSYSYPYDDKASSFTCASSAATEYTITFCPGGGTGLPVNKTDGRGV